jgi:hypothetical protein
MTNNNFALPSTKSVGSQIPTDLTLSTPESAGTAPLQSPVTGRTLYVDSASTDLSIVRPDASTKDLEGGFLNWQKGGTSISGGGVGNYKNVYTFSVPYIPPGKGIRAKVYWICNSCSVGVNKIFAWQIGGTLGSGGTTTPYAAYTSNNNSLSYAEVEIFNDPASQSNQTMIQDSIVVGLNLATAGGVSTPAQNTSMAQSLTFLFNAATSETIVTKGFIVEAIQ